MADFWYTPAKQKLAKADLDFDTMDLRLKLCMSNTTAGTDQDAALLSNITTIDQYDGVGYTDLDAAGITVTEDDLNNRSEIHINAGTFGATVAAGTRNIVGILYLKYVDGAGNDLPIAWKDVTPFNGNGGAINFTENAEGVLQVT
jgi:hypothetical protein